MKSKPKTYQLLFCHKTKGCMTVTTKADNKRQAIKNIAYAFFNEKNRLSKYVTLVK
ncbi:hypothetical protein LCGC14_1081260 [marine sediment metagenome]|uniref:Uncharacterized protein n=1 Tax=marine sediment metagenome TaxID=412755 RepID=A0A0F9QL14_9ZZZZ